MQTRNHLALSLHLIRQDRSLIRYRLAFLVGSIMPDVNLLTYIKGHTFDGTIEETQQTLEALMNQQRLSLRDTYRLGKIIHYVADYFTLPHNRIFKGGLWEHCRYERLFGKAFTRYLKTMSGGDEENIGYISGRRLTGNLVMGHQEYLKSRLSMADDCRNIIAACTFVTNAVCARRLAARPILYLKHSDHIGIAAFAQRSAAGDYNLLPRVHKLP